MYLKTLTIYNTAGAIRRIEFHKGLNLIVDNTPDTHTETGNNVGKTTVLKLIDFCLGKEGKVIYTDPSNPRTEDSEVKNFLYDNQIVIELILTHDFSNNDVVIRRNFLQRNNAIREINGEAIKNEDFEKELEKHILGIDIRKPSFRQIISHNIRYTDQSLSDTLKTMSSFTSDVEYEALFLFMFGCYYDNGAKRQSIIDKLKADRNFKSRLERNHNIGTYNSLLGLVDARIEELQSDKSRLNINPHFQSDFEKLNQIKYQINKLSSTISTLQIRKRIILEANEEIQSRKSNIDIQQLEIIYKQANALIPNMHKTFEELVNFHNQMLENKAKFIIDSLPNIEERILMAQCELSGLLKEEDTLTKKIIQSDTYEDLERIIEELNQKFKEKGEYENIIEQITKIDEEISELETEIASLDCGLYSDEFKNTIQKQINKFNVFFSKISKRLYDEEYAIQFEQTISPRTRTNVYKFSSVDANISTGKKMGEIACFDIAYTLFFKLLV